MTRLFKRDASVTVGPAKKGGAPLLSAANPVKIEGLRIAFEIEKNSESSPNPARIQIYNLSPKRRAELEEPDQALLLEAGYEGATAQLFTGNIVRVRTERRGPDLVTTIEAGDAETALRSAHVEKTYAPFTPASRVVSDLAGSLGVSLGSVAALAAQVFQGGLSLSGLVSDNLDQMTRSLGAEWHVTDGELNVLPPKVPTLEAPVLISPKTGLVGWPSKGKDGAGVEFSSLLNPDIKPGRAVVLESEALSGSFKVRRVRFSGDTHGGNWLAEVEAG